MNQDLFDSVVCMSARKYVFPETVVRRGVLAYRFLFVELVRCWQVES